MPKGTVSREILCPRTGEYCTVLDEEELIDYSIATFEYLNGRSMRDNGIDICRLNSSDEVPCGFDGWLKFMSIIGKDITELEGEK